MGNRLTLPTVIFYLLSFYLSFNVFGEQELESINVGDYKFWIANYESKCILHCQSSEKSGEIPLSIKPPYQFVRFSGGGIQKFSYEDVNVKDIIMIFGTYSVDGDKHKSKNFDKICGDGIQGLLIKKEGIFLTKMIFKMRKVGANNPLDEKMFWIMAHEKDLIQLEEK